MGELFKSLPNLLHYDALHHYSIANTSRLVLEQCFKWT